MHHSNFSSNSCKNSPAEAQSAMDKLRSASRPALADTRTVEIRMVAVAVAVAVAAPEVTATGNSDRGSAVPPVPRRRGRTVAAMTASVRTMAAATPVLGSPLPGLAVAEVATATVTVNPVVGLQAAVLLRLRGTNMLLPRVLRADRLVTWVTLVATPEPLSGTALAISRRLAIRLRAAWALHPVWLVASLLRLAWVACTPDTAALPVHLLPRRWEVLRLR